MESPEKNKLEHIEEILAERPREKYVKELLTGATDKLLEENESLSKEAELASEDALTGILNRRGIETQISRSISRLRSPGKKREAGEISNFTLVLLDIDKFKSINDTYGHDAGDEVLKRVADYLSHEVRKVDIVGRWGGEEFLLGYEASASTVLKNRFNLGKGGSETAHVMIAVPLEVNGEIINLPVTFSGGVTEWNPGDQLKDVIARADDTLYEAKQSGRNVILPWSQEISEKARKTRGEQKKQAV